MQFSPESIFSAQPVEIHGWMEVSTAYFSKVPPPYFYLVFVLFFISALSAKRSGPSIFFGSLLGAVLLMRIGIGIPFLPNLTVHGFLLGFGAIGWTIHLLKNRSSPKSATSTALVGLVALILFFTMGFPFLTSFEPVRCRSTIKNYATAVEMYQLDNEAYPSDLNVLYPNYLKSPIGCQGDSEGTYQIEVLDNDRAYVIRCTNPIHRGRPEWSASEYYGDTGLSEVNSPAPSSP